MYIAEPPRATVIVANTGKHEATSEALRNRTTAAIVDAVVVSELFRGTIYRSQHAATTNQTETNADQTVGRHRKPTIFERMGQGLKNAGERIIAAGKHAPRPRRTAFA